MNYRTIIILATIAIVMIMLSACDNSARLEPVVVTKEVSVPVGQYIEPPEELRPQLIVPSDLPNFVAPSSPAATSCLTPEGEARFRLLTGGLNRRLEAWEKWGFTK